MRRRAVAAGGCAAVVLVIVVLLRSGGAPPASRTAPNGSVAAMQPRRPVTRRRLAPAPRTESRPSAALPLSLDQLAGQRVIYAYSGLTPPGSLLATVRSGEAAGVILFGPNVADSNQVAAVVAQLQRAAAAGPVHAPLLILADQEGGQTRRLAGAPELSEQQIGASPDAVQLAAEAGEGAAGVLAGAGVNVNLAPVLDVSSQPDDFIGEFQRSYGGDPGEAARLGSAFIAAQQRLGVGATAKHFPGLGAAGRGQDTDSRPVTLDLPLKRIRDVDEAPYRAAIAAGVKLVMTSWAIYPALDSRLPAGLSPRVIQDELRGRLGFRGVTITDTLSAAALASFGTLAQRGLLAAEAGADLIICSAIDGDDSPAGGRSVLRAIASAIADGRLSRRSAEQAAARVLALRSGLSSGLARGGRESALAR